MAWVVVHGREQVGPYALELLIDEVIAGRLADTTPVWWPPLADWTTIRDNVGLLAEIERRRRTDAPGWAPTVVGDAGSEDPAGPPGPGIALGPAAQSVGTDPEVELVEPDVVELEPIGEPDGDEDDVGVVDAVITSPITGIRRSTPELAGLVDRSRRIAERLQAISAADDVLLSTMIAVGEAHGLAFTDHHSGPEEHRINLRDESGDRELTVLLGRIANGSHDIMVDPVLPLSMTLGMRNLVRPETGSSDTIGTEEHGSIVVSVDERSGRLTAWISLYLATSDYADDTLTVDADRLYRDLDMVVVALDGSLIR